MLLVLSDVAGPFRCCCYSKIKFDWFINFTDMFLRNKIILFILSSGFFPCMCLVDCSIDIKVACYWLMRASV